MAATFNKEKPKNKGIPSCYNQNHALLYMIFAFGLVTFFKLDEFIGMAGLRPLVFFGGIASIYLIVSVNFFLFRQWKVMNEVLIILFWLTFNALMIFAVVTTLILLVGWMMIVVWMAIPAWLFPLILSVLILMKITLEKKSIALPRPIIIVAIVFTTGLCSTYLLGNSALDAEFNRLESVNTDNAHYFLDVEWGWLGDPDMLILYDCNSFALACEKIYQSMYPQSLYYRSPRFNNPDRPEIKLDITDSSIRVLVDDDIWFEQDRS